jgi:hypothetical protein
MGICFSVNDFKDSKQTKNVLAGLVEGELMGLGEGFCRFDSLCPSAYLTSSAKEENLPFHRSHLK